MTGYIDKGLVQIGSRHSVEDTTRRIQSVLGEKDLTIFGVIDHSGEASRVGLEMRSTRLVIFGSPKAGTPLMVASPSSAIDLPLKALISEDASGAVWVTFNSPQYLQHRHDIPNDLIGNIAGAGALLQAAVQ